MAAKPRRASSGRCTTSCSRTSRQLDRADAREVRQGGRPRRCDSSRTRSTTSKYDAADRGRLGRGRQVRRARHAGVLHQRPSALGRAAVRRLQEGHRRGARQRRQGDQGRRQAGAGLRRAHQERQGRRRRAAPQQPQQPQPAQADPNGLQGPRRQRAGARARRRAKVTIVEFSDFQCPFCWRVEPTLTRAREGLRQGRPRRVEEQPAAVPPERACRPPRPRWRRASRASSGRCTTSCSPTSSTSTAPTFEKYAEELGLNMGKFKAALDATTRSKRQIKDDQALADEASARAARRASSSTAATSAARSRSSSSRRSSTRRSRRPTRCSSSGVKPADLYAELTKNGMDKAEGRGAAPQRRSRAQPDPNTVYKALDR